jgi:predicted  nucleic acid-binding Zn-ribbon protein
MECFSYEGADAQPVSARHERKTNEDIQEQGISPAEAFAKFAGKSVDYKATAAVWDTPRPALIAQGPTLAESPQERHQRLKAALTQFRAELQSLPKDGELAQVLLKETAALEASLEAIVADVKLAPYFSEPLTQPTQLSKTTAQLLAQLKTESKAPPGPPTPAGSKVAPPPPGVSSGLTYEFYLQQDQKAGAPDLTAIEKRVHQLEQSVGIGEPAAFSDLQSGIVHLRRKLAILESPRELEAIMRKVNNLLAELETLEEQKQQIAGAKSSTHEGAIHSLYKVIPDWDAAGRQLPGIVARLQSIKTLCEQGASARGTLTELQKEQAQMDALLLANQSSYSKLVGELTSGMKSMEAAVNSLEKTFAEVAKTRK